MKKKMKMKKHLLILALGMMFPWIAQADSDLKHAGMDHGMRHERSPDASLPVSDGSAPGDIPVPFPQGLHMVDDPLLAKFMLTQFERRYADGDDPLVWEGEAWIGKDRNKLWFKSEGERVGGSTEEAELQVLYSHAIAPFWDIQAGVRKDFKPVGREWATIGIEGLAPYFFETEAALFLGDKGRSSVRLRAEYELLFTQKTILTPEVEVNLYGKDDPQSGIGAGLSDTSLGLRLRHEFKREFAPYIGVDWTRYYGATADYVAEEGGDTSDLRWVAGVRIWF